MRAAFHLVCDVLQLDCGREDPMTEIVVTKIVELAKVGEIDPEQLRIDTLTALEKPSPPSPLGFAPTDDGGRGAHHGRTTAHSRR